MKQFQIINMGYDTYIAEGDTVVLQVVPQQPGGYDLFPDVMYYVNCLNTGAKALNEKVPANIGENK